MNRGKKIEKIARGVAISLLIISIFIGRQSVAGMDFPVTIHTYVESLLPNTTNTAAPDEDYPAPHPPFLESHWEDITEVFGINDIIFQLEQELAREAADPPPITEADIYRLRDFDYLRTQFYISDRNTRLLPNDVDVDAFVRADLTIDTAADGPKVLIFHTHSTEMFADSNPNNPMDGVLGLGARLAEILEQDYGIQTIHDTTRYDIVEGRSQIMGAYERMEPYIRQILQDNPSIEVVIDLHRDGLPEGAPPLITYIDDQRAARIMFVNGLSRRYNDGNLEAVPWLPNPYLQENLNFSFQLQLAANRLYPGFTRRVYLKAFRYSLHLVPRTMLVEVGAQNNTMEEAHNAIPHLASVIADVILP
ncbi:MAG: stage II sporulation protein P [Defluviitaleaceae bacterium]|nr:stage II sporulation protein P [Defluviitaleaceae bacterium]